MLFRWLPPIVLYGVIFWLSSLPPSRLPSGIPDIIPHFAEFLVLGYLMARAVRPRKHVALVMIFLLALLLALGDEFHQSFVPGRVCSLKDFLVDSAGALTGVFLWGRITTV